jgi:two-component system LytT family sensor kinase
MKSRPFLNSRSAAIVVIWTALALVFTPQAVLLNLGRPEPLPTWVAAARSAEIFLLWALFTPLVLHALKRYPPSGPQRARRIVLHLGVGIGLTLLHLLVLIFSLVPQVPSDATFGQLAGAVAVSVGATDVLMCAGIYAAALAILHHDERRLAERRLVEARLTALRAQLQPHFLFNTLNALAELVHRDARLAEELILKLSTLLRRALADSNALTIPLGEELAFLDDYLSIQQALLGERLRIERDIDADTLDAAVPPLLLQPLVENALRHGIALRRRGGQLRIAARRIDGALRIDIEDDGDGRSSETGSGIGQRNTRERLAAQYGEAATLSTFTLPQGGYLARLQLPIVRPA